MSTNLKKPKTLPDHPGVYVFYRGKVPLYIGKAANLKKRLASYFTKAQGLAPKVKRMLGEATRLETIKMASEIEALIKEAELIKTRRPKYNILMRDDKSYFYVAVTKEKFPRIFITHQPPKIQNPKFKIQNDKSKPKNKSPRFVGPFTSGTALKETLRLLRRIFPYCTCKDMHKRPCLNSQIGRCPGYCCLAEAKGRKTRVKRLQAEYKNNIINIVAVLSGKKTTLISKLRQDMKSASVRERYEEAGRIRNAILGLEDVFSHRFLIQEQRETLGSWSTLHSKLQYLLQTKTRISRIEGYDISNIFGTEAAGSMVVFVDGQPDKSQYRKFKIKTVAGASDVDMIKEVLTRRIGHAEWPFPNLVMIDGGKPQLNAALSVLRKSEIRNQKSETPIVTALAKREETLFVQSRRQSIQLKREHPDILRLFQQIRNEAHRFARAYHHKLRGKRYDEEKR